MSVGRSQGPVPPTIVEGLYSFQIGGSEKLGAVLARAFAARGYRLVVASFFDERGPVRDELEAAGIECHGFGVASRSRWSRFSLPRRVRAWLGDVRPAALHLHHGVTAIRAAREARACGVPRVVLTEHSSRQLRAEARYRRRLRRVLPAIDRVTVVNDELQAYFAREFGLDGARLRVLPNAVDPRYAALRRDDSARAALGLAAAHVLVYVGRLVTEKSVDVLLEAVRLARRDVGDRLRLVIAGDGPLRAPLVAQAESLGLGPSTTWLGEQRDACAALALADTFVLASQSEGLPMALLEAMSAGLPCIGTRVGGIPDALGDGAGSVVPPLQPAALARAIVQLVENPSLAATLGARARAVVAQRYALERLVDAYLAEFGLPATVREHAA